MTGKKQAYSFDHQTDKDKKKPFSWLLFGGSAVACFYDQKLCELVVKLLNETKEPIGQANV